MTDKETEDNARQKKTLTLKRSVEHSTVKQNFSHGRSKAVVVETKRRKITRPGEKPETLLAGRPGGQAAKPAAAIARPHVAVRAKAAKTGDEATGARPAFKSGTLSSTEMQARRRALEEAKIRSDQEQIQREEEARRRAIIETERAAARQERLKQQTEAESELLRRKQERADKSGNITGGHGSRETMERPGGGGRAGGRPAAGSTAAQPDSAPLPEKARRPAYGHHIRSKNDDDEGNSAGARRTAAARPELRRPSPVKGAEERRRGKLTLTTVLNDDGDAVRGRSMAAMRRRQEKFKRAQMETVREKIAREVIVPETITLQELAQRMAERSVDVIKFLMKQGQMMKPGDVIDGDMAQLITEEFGHTVKRVAESDVETGIFDIPDNAGKMQPRAPVVTVMGHVDHGKTSLLDALRRANVVANEAGGITQHIGAYQVERDGHKITFIDTPGHAAFTAMRARGAQATDIAVLVVAADDSVMPQTIESINHAKAANVPIIVAINKIDKPAADPQKVRTELLQHGVFVESLGGEVLEVEVSAKTGQNLDKLLEALLLQAEMLNLRAEADRSAEGVVIEAKLDRGRGPVATVLVQKGTLRPGTIIVAGDEWGRVRALINEHGDHMKEAGPSTPAEILGMQGTPQAGDRFAIVANEAKAREISEYRQRLSHEKAIARAAGSRGSLEQMMNRLQSDGAREFPLLIKADVQGSAEAIIASLEKLGNDEVRARIIHAGAGGITESDVALATASDAAIIGFNVRANPQAREAAANQGIEIRYYNIIYDLVDDVKAAMSGMLSPERRETFIGNAEILEVFDISKIGKVAGCRVTEGKVERGAGVRLIRDNVVIHEGKLKTLKRFKDEVAEVPAGQECGMAFENYTDMRAGDVIEAFRVEHINRSL
ncbi:MAG: translation initiation factor IF-2 [Candidatus Tokpelaia sp.]|nr:MAG: translation initiation factor IF-2 [Candidatus Tokpelaia sp.]KAA6205341.1 MAG: translation initiation factor IF-2 [Candidatus Tokpelaia sp.]